MLRPFKRWPAQRNAMEALLSGSAAVPPRSLPPFPRRRIFIGLPDRAARADILRVTLRGERLAGDVDIDSLAAQTEGYSGADLKQLCVAAAMRPVRSYLEQEGAAKAAGAAAGAAGAAGAAAPPPGDQEEPAQLEEQPAAASAAGSVAGSAGEAEEGGEGGSGASTPTSLPAPAASSAALPLVPRLGSLLRQAETLAAAPGSSRTDLRPVSMQASGALAGVQEPGCMLCACLSCLCLHSGSHIRPSYITTPAGL